MSSKVVPFPFRFLQTLKHNINNFKGEQTFVSYGIYLCILLTFYYTGFKETNKGCCGTGTFEVTPLCNELTPACDDASKYVFWDSVHPSEATNKYIAKYLELEVLPKFQVHRNCKFD